MVRLQNATLPGYLRELPWSTLHTQDPRGSFKSQWFKEAQSRSRGSEQKTVGTVRTLGPGEGEQIAKEDREGLTPGRGLQRPLPEARLLSQTLADFRRPPTPPWPAPARPLPPASRGPPLQDTHSENAKLRLEESGPRSCAASLESEPTHAPLLGSCALATARRARLHASENAGATVQSSIFGRGDPGHHLRIPRELTENADFLTVTPFPRLLNKHLKSRVPDPVF